MFKNYIQVAFSALWRRRTFTFLNVLGLSVGIASALVLFLVIRFETSFDKFHRNRDRIYRVISVYTGGTDGTGYSQGVPIVLTGTLRNEFTQFSKVAASRAVYGAQFNLAGTGTEGTRKFKQDKGIFYVEPGLFDIFDFPWIYGAPFSLKEPNTIAIEQSVAQIWFGEEWRQAIGKSVRMDNTQTYRIVGIMKDHPDNTDLPIRVALSYASYADKNSTNWGNVSSAYNLYALLAPGVGIKDANAQIPGFADRHFGNDKDNLEKSSIEFQPLAKMHFDDRVTTPYADFESGTIGIKQLWALGLIGAFLLFVACVNFVNLATAQSVNRSKEIGVRKVLGSSKSMLIRQFLGETFFITVIALFLSCIWAEMGTRFYLNDQLGKPLSLNFLANPSILGFLLGIVVIVTLLAGFYPALILSGFNPVNAIKNKISPKSVGGLSLRRGLVIVQFAIAQMLVIGTLVVVKQMNYFQAQSLGFDKNAILMVDLPQDSVSREKFDFLKQNLLQDPGVINASLCSSAPSSGWVWGGDFKFDNRPQHENFDLSFRMNDSNYYSTFHITLLAGRVPYPSDTIKEFVINELTLHKLGFKDPQAILGKTIQLGNKQFPIVGVVKNFNSQSLQSPLSSIAMSTRKSYYRSIAVRLNPAQVETTMKRVQKDWEKTFPDFIYNAGFLDKDMDTYYSSERLTSRLFQIFSCIALIISCLGLYGLVSFMAVQREKEVGVRKVLGATVFNIVYLFSKEFTLLVALAFLIAAPVGGYFMNQWLQGYIYRTNLGWNVFIASIIGTLLVAWLTVVYKALRAAMTNPMKSLRSE